MVPLRKNNVIYLGKYYLSCLKMALSVIISGRLSVTFGLFGCISDAVESRFGKVLLL